LSKLDHDTAIPPADLSARVLDAVAQARNTIRFDPKARPLPVEVDTRRGGAALLTLREVMGLAAAIIVFVGIFVPGYHKARDAAQRTACMDNVRRIGTGYTSYAAANGGYMPYVGAAMPGASWVRTDEVGVPRMSNGQHAFRLMSGGLVQSPDFVCPSRAGDYPMNAEDFSLFQDWPVSQNNSYSTDFVRGPVHISVVQPGMALLADKNPLIEGGRLVPGVRPGANSPNHGRPGGQNVLRYDMSAVWSPTPRTGTGQDDIYQIEGVEQYRGVENPRSQTDAFLIP
jgi:hypothetical protein